MKSSQTIGDTISMKVGENITLDAADNKSTSDTKESSKSNQAGMNFAPTGNSFYANASKGQGNETEETLTHTSSQVIARKDLTTESGEDTTLRVSNAYGDKVSMKVGGNLTIESVQAKDNYTSHNESKGMGLSTGTSKATAGHGGMTIGTSKGQTDSNYESVTNQAGITAGGQGYDISVKDNTHLKGGVIDSNATKDRNTLTTGTLTWEDIENKADYKATADGRNYSASWFPKETVNDKKVGGLTGSTSPVKSQPVKGKVNSTTKSAISEGTITITDKEHQKQDLSDINRDTKNTLNQLEKIFDKEKVQERQELANEFAKLGAEKIGDIASEKGWDKNDPRRTLLHGLLGGITAKLGGNNVLSGAMAEGGMESLQPLLDNFLKDHPDMREEVASIFGYATGKLFGGDGDVGAATAWNGTKFNWLTHEQLKEYEDELAKAKTPEEKAAIRDKYKELDRKQNDAWLEQQKQDVYDNIFGNYGNLPYGIPPLHVEANSNGALNAGSTFAKDALAGGLDYRAAQVTGRTAPVGTLMNTIASILDDSDVNKYGYYGAKRRILFDIVVSSGELYMFKNFGLLTGIGFSTAADIGFGGAKDALIPPLLPHEVEKKKQEEQEDLIKNGMD